VLAPYPNGQVAEGSRSLSLAFSLWWVQNKWKYPIVQ
jgi:hypothetical protein